MDNQICSNRRASSDLVSASSSDCRAGEFNGGESGTFSLRKVGVVRQHLQNKDRQRKGPSPTDWSGPSLLPESHTLQINTEKELC